MTKRDTRHPASQLFDAHEALVMALEAMNYMGDILNGMDAVEAEDEEVMTPAFNKVRAVIKAISGKDPYIKPECYGHEEILKRVKQRSATGVCPTCGGRGKVEINSEFPEPIDIPCPDCADKAPL